MRRAYLVHVEEFVLIVDDSDPRDVEIEAADHASERVRARLLTAEELRAHGDAYPVGWWDPDRELTCEQVASEMPLAMLLHKAERLGAFVGRLLEHVA